eukprot:4189688-Lingulodinium_polyedra.AAC.1
MPVLTRDEKKEAEEASRDLVLAASSRASVGASLARGVRMLAGMLSFAWTWWNFGVLAAVGVATWRLA